MTDQRLYNWNDSHPYLGFLIVRLGDRYAIIDPDPHSGQIVWEYDTVEQAKQVVEHFYIEHLLFEALESAAEAGIVDVATSENLMWHATRQVLDNHHHLPLPHLLGELRNNHEKTPERLRPSNGKF